MLASEWDYTECTSLLLKAGANPNIQNKFYWTALMYASSNGHIKSVRLLLQAGANPNIKDNRGYTALMEAKLYKTKKYKKIVKILKRMIMMSLLNNYF